MIPFSSHTVSQSRPARRSIHTRALNVDRCARLAALVLVAIAVHLVWMATPVQGDVMEDMIDHHQMAVHTATMCMEKAIHPELRDLCQQIVTTQTQEIQMMQSWLASWYGVRHEPHMNAGHMREMERLASLSGAEFEVAFMEMMIRHHAMAVKEGERCVERAYHGELRQLRQDIITSQ
ncbi:MAG: DUF305 domain-containing protein [Chloroflexi bacterium]|nr:DUF305 domain-containing protein [Chloroflexota bacterium]